MSEGAILAVTVPRWGMTMEEGTLTAWHVEEGAPVAAGDALADLESTKIANVIEAAGPGLLRRRVAAEGSTLPVGVLLAVIAAEEVADDAIDAFVAAFATRPRPQTAAGTGLATVECDGRRVAYAVHGEGGEPLLLVHGFGGDMNAWMFNQEPLAAGGAVFSLDLPGHGASSKEVGEGGLDLLAAAVAAVMEAAGSHRVHLVGHSLGGAAALLAARERPDAVASLTLIAPVGFGEEIDGSYIAGFVAARRRREMAPLARRLFADRTRVTRRTVETMLRARRIDGVEPALAAIAAACFDGDRQRLDLASCAETLTMPMQVVWGAEDAILPCRHAQRLAGAAVHIVEGAGHMVAMERAGEVNALIASFAARDPA